MGRQGNEILALVFTEGTRTRPRHPPHHPTPNARPALITGYVGMRNSLEEGAANGNRPAVAKSSVTFSHKPPTNYLKENTTAHVNPAASCHPHCRPGSYLCDFQYDFKMCSEFIWSLIMKLQLGQSACPQGELGEDTHLCVFPACC